MRAIVNVNRHWGIGCDGDLLVMIPEDMKFFRSTTAGKIVIMGRKTLDSFPGRKPLKGRVNIVMTADPARISQAGIESADHYFSDISSAGMSEILRSLAAKVLAQGDAPVSERPTVLAAAGSIEEITAFCAQFPKDEIYVIGGASVYEKLLPYCDTCLVTVNDSEKQPDTWFPDLDASPEWKCSVRGEPRRYEGVTYRFDTYVRI